MLFNFPDRLLLIRTIVLGLFAYFVLAPLFAQNIVLNPSFETNLQIPQTVSSVGLIVNWDNASPSVTTPDYFHVLSPSPGVVQLPSNVWGNTLPFDGQAVAGLYCFAPQNYREYLRTQFSSPMLEGQQYFVRFAITMGNRDSSALNLGATDGFGLYFSLSPPSQGVIAPAYTGNILVTPQWQLPGVFGDSLWQIVSFSIWPDTTWNYATFGNFLDNANTFQESSGAVSYLFLDRVEVSPVLNLSGPSVACQGDSVWYVASPSGGDYQWLVNGNLAGAGDSLLVQADSAMNIEIQAPAISRSRSLSILPNPVIDLGPDTTVCMGDTLEFSISPLPNWDWIWSDGSQNQGLSATGAGTVSILVDSTGCVSVDTVNISVAEIPVVQLGDDSTLCMGDSLILNLPTASFRIWHTGSSDSIFVAKEAEWVWGEAGNQCGSDRDSVLISIREVPVPDLPDDQQICPGDSVVLDPALPVNATFMWSDSFPTLSRPIDQEGRYILSFLNECGESADTIHLDLLGLPKAEIRDPEILCEDDSVELVGEGLANIWRWNGAISDSLIVVNQPGWYVLRAENACGFAVDSLLLEQIPVPSIDLGKDTTLCEGQMLSVGSVQPGVSYLWENGSREPTRQITEAGQYRLEASNECGVVNEDLTVEFEQPLTLNMGPDTTICDGEILILERPEDLPAFSWPDGSEGKLWELREPGLVIVSAFNACGMVVDSLWIGARQCDCHVYVPTAFSPNFDGINDSWRIGYTCEFLQFECQVFDRWGRGVARFHTPDMTWTAENIPEGVYVWKLRYQWLDQTQQPKEIISSGSVTVIR